MATDIDSIVSVNITQQDTTISTVNFTTPCFMATFAATGVTTTPFDTRTRTYTDATQVLADGFASNSYAYLSAQAAFDQTPKPASILIARHDAAETYVEAVAAVMAETEDWSILTTDAAWVDGGTDSTYQNDVLTTAAFIETTVHFYCLSSNEAAIITTATNDIFTQLKTLGYKRTFYMWNEKATTQSPEAAWVGRFGSEQAGSNVWLEKGLVGVTPSNLSPTVAGYIKSKNGSYYTTVAGTNIMFGSGKTAAGEWIDIEIFVEWLRSNIQQSVFTTLLNNKKVSFTTNGAALIESALRNSLQDGINVGGLSPSPAPVINMPNVNNLSSTTRNSRNLSGITFVAQLAGAILYVDGIQGTVSA